MSLIGDDSRQAERKATRTESRPLNKKQYDADLTNCSGCFMPRTEQPLVKMSSTAANVPVDEVAIPASSCTVLHQQPAIMWGTRRRCECSGFSARHATTAISNQTGSSPISPRPLAGFSTHTFAHIATHRVSTNQKLEARLN
jgi:hypothetical protein